MRTDLLRSTGTIFLDEIGEIPLELESATNTGVDEIRLCIKVGDVVAVGPFKNLRIIAREGQQTTFETKNVGRICSRYLENEVGDRQGAGVERILFSFNV